MAGAVAVAALAGCHNEPYKADAPVFRVVGTPESVIEVAADAARYAGIRRGFIQVGVDASSARVTNHAPRDGRSTSPDWLLLPADADPGTLAISRDRYLTVEAGGGTVRDRETGGAIFTVDGTPCVSGDGRLVAATSSSLRTAVVVRSVVDGSEVWQRDLTSVCAACRDMVCAVDDDGVVLASNAGLVAPLRVRSSGDVEQGPPAAAVPGLTGLAIVRGTTVYRTRASWGVWDRSFRELERHEKTAAIGATPTFVIAVQSEYDIEGDGAYLRVFIVGEAGRSREVGTVALLPSLLR